MPDTCPILCARSITTVLDGWYDTGIQDFSLTLNAGELALIRFDRHTPRTPLPDAIMGLVELTMGEAFFMGESWSALSPGAAGQSRGKIGRYFGEHTWVNHLDVDENITLRQRHHTRRPLAEIEDEAEEIARAMGLKNGLPCVRPTNVDPLDLQRSACVRMLLGTPPLLVIDEPPAGLFSEVLGMLTDQVTKARARGAAVFWLSPDPYVWADVSPRATHQIDLTTRRAASASLE